mmetsp:Transcript_20369/g.50012  ORF Transcript_20369/g.50012 Transcript_20369/m.50012 type:complete len:124 (+) Transcript_20369:261-632(+)
MNRLAGLRRHMFICVSEKSPEKSCASRQVQEAAWKQLKRRVVELGLLNVAGRTKASCLQVCKEGPVAVVYDHHGATWYRKCSGEVLDKIIESHLVNGDPCKEHVLVTNPNAVVAEVSNRHSPL